MAGSITWLGHAAFRFDTPSGDRIYVDPWLTGNPTCPAAELEPERVDAILVTHGHNDHVGDAVRLARAFACPVIAQVELRGVIGAEIGEDMGQAVNKGGGVDLLGARVTLTHANHSSSYEKAPIPASRAASSSSWRACRRSTSRATPTCSATWR